MATRTKLRVADMRAAINNASLCRSLSIGTSWTKLRVAMRLALSADPGANLTGDPCFAAGLCSGTTNPWDNGSGVTTHFVGVKAAFTFFTRNVSGGTIGLGANRIFPSKRVGTTTTEDSTFTTFTTDPQYGFAADADAFRTLLFFVDITKGAPNFTLQAFFPNTLIATETDVTFLALADVEAPVKAGYLHASALSLAVSEETDGVLNAVNVAWNKAAPQMEVADIAIVRFL